MAVNLNKASKKDLTELSGVGNKLAERIIKYREEHGEFESWEDVKEIPGFEDAMVDNLKSAGAQLTEITEKVEETAQKITEEVNENVATQVREQAEKVAEYTDDYADSATGFMTRVRDSYLTGCKFGLSLMQKNLRMTNSYVKQWMSLQRGMFSSMVKFNPLISRQRKD